MLNLKVFSFLNIASIEIQHATLIKCRGSEKFPVFFNTLEFYNIEEKIIIQKALNDDDGLKDGRK